MREIVLDTETTGLDPLKGDRVCEIGCVELVNYLPTGKIFHAYINPERDVPEVASAISGLTTDFLRNMPRFIEIVDDFLAFVEGAPLVIHNARFDIGFLNAELSRIKKKPFILDNAIDTLKIARKKFPGSPASLDALCRRFSIDLSARTKHGALLDSELLAQVYLELRGGRQRGFEFAVTKETIFASEKNRIATASQERAHRVPRFHEPTLEERRGHEALVTSIKDALWLKDEGPLPEGLKARPQ